MSVKNSQAGEGTGPLQSLRERSEAILREVHNMSAEKSTGVAYMAKSAIGSLRVWSLKKRARWRFYHCGWM